MASLALHVDGGMLEGTSTFGIEEDNAGPDVAPAGESARDTGDVKATARVVIRGGLDSQLGS